MYNIGLKFQLYFYNYYTIKNLTNYRYMYIIYMSFILYFYINTMPIEDKEQKKAPEGKEWESIVESVKRKLSNLKDDVLKFAEKIFGWITLSKDKTYDVPWIARSPKTNKNKEFPNIKFGDCRLSKQLWSVVYSDSLVILNNWQEKRESHKETFYSQKVLPWWALKIPWRHVAEDGTVRDEDWFICVAAPLNIYPKWSQIMTTLWPGKVYDTWHMKGKHIDIYTNW